MEWDPMALNEIVARCTTQYRKGAAVTRDEKSGVEVVEIYFMDPIPEDVDETKTAMVDLVFFVAGVDLEKARDHRPQIEGLLAAYPEPARLAGGPSYIELGGALGDQGMALCLMAMGKALGLWDIITPATVGMEGDEAQQMAGNGFIMVTGWSPATEVVD